MIKENVTVSLSYQTLQKAKIFAERRETLISELLTEPNELLVAKGTSRRRLSAKRFLYLIKASIWAAQFV